MNLQKVTVISVLVAAVISLEMPAQVIGSGKAMAQEANDAKRRVNLAGRQRMLTQRMTKAFCMVALGVERDLHNDMLRASHDDFAAAIKGLRHGDTDLGLVSAERNSRVLVGLGEVDALWKSFDAAMSHAIETNSFSGPDADQIYTENMPLLAKMNELVSSIEQVYANPNDMLLANAVAINIAGRQRMLSQRIGKEFCQINLGWRIDEVKASLSKTVQLFESSHAALANGMPHAGIIEPPTVEIKQALVALEQRWKSQKVLVDRALAGETISPSDLQTFATDNDLLLREMHAIVGLYENV